MMITLFKSQWVLPRTMAPIIEETTNQTESQQMVTSHLASRKTRHQYAIKVATKTSYLATTQLRIPFKVRAIIAKIIAKNLLTAR